MIKSMILAITMLYTSSALSLPVGKIPPVIEIKGDEGGRTDDSPWSSSTLTGKVHMLFYVDPDEKDVNEELEARLDKEKFDRAKFGSVAVINQKATWLPNVAIDSKLESKQKEFPNTVYVRDKVSKLVTEWKLKDDAYVVVIFDKQGKVLYHKTDKLTKADIETVVSLVKKHM